MIYKLIDSDKDDITTVDINGNRRKRTPGFQIAGRKKIFDPFAKRTVEISNVVKKKTIKTPQGVIIKEDPEPIRFTSERSAITLKFEDNDTYEFLERIYENQDNPFRPANAKVRPVFYRVDAKKKVMKENELRELRVDAMNWVYKEATLTDLKACAQALNKVYKSRNIHWDYKDDEASTGYEMLKRELSAIAEKSPEIVIKACTDLKLKMRLQIKDSRRFSIIMIDDSQRQWFHNDKDMTPICTVEATRNAEDALLEFFTKNKDGGKHYTKMVDTLEAFLTPR